MKKNLSDPCQILQKAEACIQYYIGHTLGLNHFRSNTFDQRSKDLSRYLLLAEEWIKAIKDSSRCVAVLIHKSSGQSICGHSRALDNVLAVNNFSYFKPDKIPKGEYNMPYNRPQGEYGKCAEPLAWNQVRNTENSKDCSDWISVAFGTPTANSQNRTDEQLARLIPKLPEKNSDARTKAEFLNKEMPKIWGILASNPWWSLKPPCRRCKTWVMPDGIAPKGSWTGKDKLGGAIVFKDNTYQIVKNCTDLPPDDYPAANRVWDFLQRFYLR